MMKCRLAANSTAISMSMPSTGSVRAVAAASSGSAAAPRQHGSASARRSGRLAGRSGASTAGVLRTAPCGRPEQTPGRTTSTTAITRNSATSVSLRTKLKTTPKIADVPMRDAQRLDLGDQQRGEVGAGDAAHAADHHHDEGVADGQQVHSGWPARAASAARRPGRRAARRARTRR
jgi:hypothetical protein